MKNSSNKLSTSTNSLVLEEGKSQIRNSMKNKFDRWMNNLHLMTVYDARSFHGSGPHEHECVELMKEWMYWPMQILS